MLGNPFTPSCVRLNKTAKEIWDAYTSGTAVLLRRQDSSGSYVVSLHCISRGTVTDANNAEFTSYDFNNDEYYAYGDNYYPVSDESVAMEEAGFATSSSSQE